MLRKRIVRIRSNFCLNDYRMNVTQGGFRMEEEKKKLFGRLIYGSKDVPIRILDGLIVGMILLAVVLTVIFSINGGYRVTFDTRGGGEIPYQKLRY